jgi:hypothetical protein
VDNHLEKSVKRLLLPLEPQVLESYVDLQSLEAVERQKLASGEGRCYLAQDPTGVATVFLAITLQVPPEDGETVRSQYSESLKLQQDLSNLAGDNNLHEPFHTGEK